MFSRFKPKNNLFYDLFSSCGHNLASGGKTLSELLQPSPDFVTVSEKMAELEHACDDITHELFRTLNSSFVTPFDRSDIYSLGSALDDVMDHMEAATQLMTLYGITELTPHMRQMVEILDKCGQVTAEALPRLRSLDGLDGFWIEINNLENRADSTYRSLLADLFGGDYDALTVMKLKDVGDELEDAADAFETVANIVESIVLKES
ncbi:DUF47 family protein [Rhodococcus sp. X156]|uniref:DUF47 domain-containing protein n=1 Tax=Rhodococcus sp. X156 TaxID=2499145 RepID=UPI000FD93775|nr:DUF47 family protein [Rhodococcus sp. X156]